MALHKVFLCVFVVSMGVTDARSARDSSISSAEHDSSSRYRFAEEYLIPEATHDSSRKHEANECERVVKNSMICMVCKDSESNAKYERCSYVSEPSNRSFDYAKSKVEKAPEYEGSQSRLSKSRSASRNHEESDEESKQAEESRRHPKSQREPTSEYISESERITKKHDKDKCKEEERDGMSCMICVDPDTGGNFEKCSYAYEPNDKVYKFSKSKRYGYPEGMSSNGKTSKSPRRIDDDEDINSEETKQIEKKENDNCHEEIRDSMTCTICKDPKSGGNSEKCSYSYKPDDKLYAYSQSRSFGSPKSQEN